MYETHPNALPRCHQKLRQGACSFQAPDNLQKSGSKTIHSCDEKTCIIDPNGLLQPQEFIHATWIGPNLNHVWII